MSDKAVCWSWCASTKDCNWVSYETTGIQMCSLFKNCNGIDEENYPQYISGHRDCQFTQCKLIRYFVQVGDLKKVTLK